MRDYYEIGRSDFWWSDVAAELPYRNLTAAFVLDGARVARITDFGTSYTEPEDYLDHVAGFGLFTTDGGGLTPVPLDTLDGLVAAVRPVQRSLYRTVAAMDRDEKIRCGAFVYFAFLKRFAEVAGCADDARLDRARATSRRRSTSSWRPWTAPTSRRIPTLPTTSRWRDLRAGRRASPPARARPGVDRDVGLRPVGARRVARRVHVADARSPTGAGRGTGRCWCGPGNASSTWPTSTPRSRARASACARRVCGPTTCARSPFEQWTVQNECYAVALDDPADALGRAYGESTPVAFDVEWYADGARSRRPPTATARPARPTP